MRKEAVKFGLLVSLIFLLLSTQRGIADDGPSRTHHRLGLYVGVIEPFPCLVSGNVGLNVFSFLRLTGGYGTISASTSSGNATVTTLGAGGRLFVPGWSFSPTAGLSWAKVNVTGTLSTAVYGFNQSGSLLYIPIGIDWQTMGGFNFGAGYNYSLKTGISGAPYVTLGWFFF